MRLQHVAATFPPGRDGAIREFYGDVLGLAEEPVPQAVAHLGWVWFATRDDGIELHFIPDETPPDPARRHHFCLQVDDLAPVRERLARAGADVVEARDRIPGRDRVFTRDPEGNLVELVQFASDASLP
jgi:catechol 2,3-dioxygenase-like lactoylglutathione lyase family enzyme